MHEQFTHENKIVFVTTDIDERHQLFTNDAFCMILRDELFFYAKQYNVDLLAFVIMPEHLHCLIWPQGNKTFSDYMRGVKSHSAKLIIEHLHRREPPLPPGDTAAAKAAAYVSKKIEDPYHKRGLKHKIWQPSFFPYLISDTTKLEEKFEYIRNNPVKAGLVEKPEDYQWLYVNSKIYEIE